MLGVVEPNLPPEGLLREARFQTGERWALLAFIPILVGLVGLAHDWSGLAVLLALRGSGAAMGREREV